MTEFIFYTDEGRTISPNDTELENLQVLGIAKGESTENAFKNLVEENIWISETGFDARRIVARRLAESP